MTGIPHKSGFFICFVEFKYTSTILNAQILGKYWSVLPRLTSEGFHVNYSGCSHHLEKTSDYLWAGRHGERNISMKDKELLFLLGYFKFEQAVYIIPWLPQTPRVASGMKYSLELVYQRRFPNKACISLYCTGRRVFWAYCLCLPNRLVLEGFTSGRCRSCK